MKEIHRNNTKVTRDSTTEEVIPNQVIIDKGKKLVEEADKILNSLTDELTKGAQEFVDAFKQKGGE